MFVPKEIAPYLGMIAPMVAPQLGILGSMALSQAGSIKMHGGKLDPYSAASTAIALSSPQARAIRAAGRVDPSQGTIGQKMSSYIGKSLDSMGGTNDKSFLSTLGRGFDPTRAMDKATAGGFDSYYENPFMAEFDSKNQYTTFLDDSGNKQSFSKVRKTKDNIIQDTFDEKYGLTRADRGVAGLTAEEKIKHDELIALDKANAASGTKTTLAKDYLQSDVRAFGDMQTAKGFDKFKLQAGEFGSNVAGAIFPGFGKYDPVTGAFVDKSFDFGKALQTVSIAGTIGGLKAIGEELKKQKQLDEEKQREIWSTYFDSYLRTTGRTYDQSMYADPELLEKYNRFMLASGGRVGYNMGGLTEGIMGSSGVPQGMQVDGRNGAFIPMGVEEKADDVPAMLSKNEFVMTADAVKAAGDGDANKGAQRMYDLMHNLEAQV